MFILVCMEQLVRTLKAAGEPSRLRILAVLQNHELTVGELVQILGQSQPRVSRHLRVLSEAGLLRRNAEGTSAFYRLHTAGPDAALVHEILTAARRDTTELARDRERLGLIHQARSERAGKYFERVAADWDDVRNRHVPDADIEAAILQTIDGRDIDQFVDLGTGTGRILEIAGPRVGRGLGVDLSRDMLAVARDKLERSQLHNCQVRLGDIRNLDLAAGSVDAAVIHHVLHFLHDPSTVIDEAARVLRPGGVLIVVDFAPHELTVLRDEHAHLRLGFSATEVSTWCRAAGLQDVTSLDFVHDHADRETLTVTIWTAVQHADAPSTYNLEVA